MGVDNSGLVLISASKALLANSVLVKFHFYIGIFNLLFFSYISGFLILALFIGFCFVLSAFGYPNFIGVWFLRNDIRGNAYSSMMFSRISKS